MRPGHEELGHFGVKRTYSLLLGQYWWLDMHTQVQQLASRCMVCDQMRASFNASTLGLHMGLDYRWSLNFAGVRFTLTFDNTTSSVYVGHGGAFLQVD